MDPGLEMKQVIKRLLEWIKDNSVVSNSYGFADFEDALLQYYYIPVRLNQKVESTKVYWKEVKSILISILNITISFKFIVILLNPDPKFGIMLGAGLLPFNQTLGKMLYMLMVFGLFPVTILRLTFLWAFRKNHLDFLVDFECLIRPTETGEDPTSLQKEILGLPTDQSLEKLKEIVDLGFKLCHISCRLVQLLFYGSFCFLYSMAILESDSDLHRFNYLMEGFLVITFFHPATSVLYVDAFICIVCYYIILRSKLLTKRISSIKSGLFSIDQVLLRKKSLSQSRIRSRRG